MATGLELVTGAPRTSAPIVIEDSSPEAGVEYITVESVGNKTQPFTINYKKVEGKHLAEFILFLPGKYKVTSGEKSILLYVEQQRDLSFLSEMVLLVPFVLVILLGVVLWTKKKKNAT